MDHNITSFPAEFFPYLKLLRQGPSHPEPSTCERRVRSWLLFRCHFFLTVKRRLEMAANAEPLAEVLFQSLPAFSSQWPAYQEHVQPKEILIHYSLSMFRSVLETLSE